MDFDAKQAAPRGYVIRVIAVAGCPQLDGDVAGMWIEGFDVDAFGGRGATTLTARAERALVFDTPNAAFDAWRTQSKKKPLRDDGEPNRPLTSYSVEIEPMRGAIHDAN